jgi:hypothetical protein
VRSAGFEPAIPLFYCKDQIPEIIGEKRNIMNGQTNITPANSTNTIGLVNIQDIPLQKVRVGDIEMAYKMFSSKLTYELNLFSYMIV